MRKSIELCVVYQDGLDNQSIPLQNFGVARILGHIEHACCEHELSKLLQENGAKSMHPGNKLYQIHDQDQTNTLLPQASHFEVIQGKSRKRREEHKTGLTLFVLIARSQVPVAEPNFQEKEQ